MSQSHADLMRRVAETDSTFVLNDGRWVGRCLICGGPLCFDNRTGDGATIERILPRSLGGTNDLRNLGVAHMRCNNEKGAIGIRADDTMRDRIATRRCSSIYRRNGSVAGEKDQ